MCSGSRCLAPVYGSVLTIAVEIRSTTFSVTFGLFAEAASLARRRALVSLSVSLNVVLLPIIFSV